MIRLGLRCESWKKGLGLAWVEDGTEMNRTERVIRVENRDMGWRAKTPLIKQHS